MRSVHGLLRQKPMMLVYYRNKGMADWVCSLQQRQLVDCTLVFSLSRAQYARFELPQPVLADFVEVDSAKWTDYAIAHCWPLSRAYKRQGWTRLADERAVAARADHAFFSSEWGTGLFRLAPGRAKQVVALRRMLTTNANNYVRQIDALLAAPERAFTIGRAGREHVLTAYGSDASLQRLDDYFVRIPTESCGTCV